MSDPFYPTERYGTMNNDNCDNLSTKKFEIFQCKIEGFETRSTLAYEEHLKGHTYWTLLKAYKIKLTNLQHPTKKSLIQQIIKNGN